MRNNRYYCGGIEFVSDGNGVNGTYHAASRARLYSKIEALTVQNDLISN